ncbi:hypothetical protein D3C72_259140 [compost metagenome]
MRIFEITEDDKHNTPEAGYAVALNNDFGKIVTVDDASVVVAWDRGGKTTFDKSEWIFYFDPYSNNGEGRFNMVGPFR